MKSIKGLFLFIIAFYTIQSNAQGSGKVTLRADIKTNNETQFLHVSVVDLCTKIVIQREEVKNSFFASLPLGGKFMLYFKKQGHPSARLLVDTTTDKDDYYFIHFSMDLITSHPELETGISNSVGTLKFNPISSNFQLEAPSSGTLLLDVEQKSVEQETARF